MNYGDNLMFLKDRNGLTNVQMASIIKISDSLYSRYEKEKQIIPIKHLNSYSIYFNVSIDYLLGLTSITNYKKEKKLIDKSLSAKRLKEFRKENNLTQLELSKLLGIDNSTLSKYEQEKQIIATQYLFTISSKYHISADYLLGKTHSPKHI